MFVLKKLSVLLLASTLLLWGCAQPTTQTQKGAMYGTGIGAAVGAGLGQVIGGNTKSTLIGAGLGAALGGVAGGSIGRYMDNQEEALRQQFNASEAASVQRTADVLAVTFKSDVLFDVNSSTLKAGAYTEIDRVATVLQQYPQTTIQIAGHTDNSFDIGNIRIFRIPKNYNIASFRCLVINHFLIQNRQADTVFVFIYQYEIPYQQGRHHRGRWNSKWFCNKRTQD